MLGTKYSSHSHPLILASWKRRMHTAMDGTIQPTYHNIAPIMPIQNNALRSSKSGSDVLPSKMSDQGTPAMATSDSAISTR